MGLLPNGNSPPLLLGLAPEPFSLPLGIGSGTPAVDQVALADFQEVVERFAPAGHDPVCRFTSLDGCSHGIRPPDQVKAVPAPGWGRCEPERLPMQLMDRLKNVESRRRRAKLASVREHQANPTLPSPFSSHSNCLETHTWQPSRVEPGRQRLTP